MMWRRLFRLHILKSAAGSACRVGANETSKFWLGMLNDLKNRGVQDVLFFCVDGLPGFKTQSRPFSHRHRSSAV